MIAGSSGSTHGDSTLKTPAPNAAMSEGIWGSVMGYTSARRRVNTYCRSDARQMVKKKTTSPNFSGDSFTKPSLIQTVLDYKTLLLTRWHELGDQDIFSLVL
jgi:hypothetical protein